MAEKRKLDILIPEDPNAKSSLPLPLPAAVKIRVEDRLGDLLDTDWGVRKRRQAINGLIQLLSSCSTDDQVTTRDLSLLLDPILKTRDQWVLKQMFQKRQGLEILRKIIVLNKDNFMRTPIIHKVFTVLKYLTEQGILTSELVNTTVGKESLRQSILGLTGHKTLQIHQVARDFRDKWLFKSFAMKSTPTSTTNSRVVMKFATKEGMKSMTTTPRVENCKRKSVWDEALEERLEEGEVSEAQRCYLVGKIWKEAKHISPWKRQRHNFPPWA